MSHGRGHTSRLRLSVPEPVLVSPRVGDVTGGEDGAAHREMH